MKNNLEEISETIVENPDASGLYIQRGIIFYERKEYDRSLNDLTKAIELCPNNPEAYFHRGTVQIEQHNYEKGIEDLTSSIRLLPNYSKAYNERGKAFMNLKELRPSIEDFSQAIRIDPGYSDAYLNRGIAFHLSKEYEKSMSDYTRAIEADPKNSLAYSNRGKVLWVFQDFEKSIEDFKSAYELDPNNTEASNTLEFISTLFDFPPPSPTTEEPILEKEVNREEEETHEIDIIKSLLKEELEVKVREAEKHERIVEGMKEEILDLQNLIRSSSSSSNNDRHSHQRPVEQKGEEGKGKFGLSSSTLRKIESEEDFVGGEDEGMEKRIMGPGYYLAVTFFFLSILVVLLVLKAQGFFL